MALSSFRVGLLCPLPPQSRLLRVYPPHEVCSGVCATCSRSVKQFKKADKRYDEGRILSTKNNEHYSTKLYQNQHKTYFEALVHDEYFPNRLRLETVLEILKN